MGIKWRKHVYPDGEVTYFGKVDDEIDPPKSDVVFELAWAKFFKELAKREELKGKKGVTCCVEITSGDFTFYAFRSNSRDRQGTHVSITFPFATKFSDKLYDKTEGAPPFDEELNRLTAGYVKALRDKFDEARPGNSDLLLCVIDPEGEAV